MAMGFRRAGGVPLHSGLLSIPFRHLQHRTLHTSGIRHACLFPCHAGTFTASPFRDRDCVFSPLYRRAMPVDAVGFQFCRSPLRSLKMDAPCLHPHTGIQRRTAQRSPLRHRHVMGFRCGGDSCPCRCRMADLAPRRPLMEQPLQHRVALHP